MTMTKMPKLGAVRKYANGGQVIPYKQESSAFGAFLGAANQATQKPKPMFTQNPNPPIRGMKNGMPDYGYGDRYRQQSDTNPARPKGTGYYGEVRRPDGNISSELGVDIGHGEIPSMVPGMTPIEMQTAISGGKYTDGMYDKAGSHAAFRQLNGQSPWAGINDKQELLPTNNETIVSNALAHPNDPEIGIKGYANGGFIDPTQHASQDQIRATIGRPMANTLGTNSDADIAAFQSRLNTPTQPSVSYTNVNTPNNSIQKVVSNTPSPLDRPGLGQPRQTSFSNVDIQGYQQKPLSAQNTNTSNNLIDSAIDEAGTLWGFKDGGEIKGPGTGTSDSIPAALPEGAFIIPAAVVRHYGVAKFDKMNGVSDKSPAGQSIPAMVSNGEYQLSPDAVRRIGTDTLNKLIASVPKEQSADTKVVDGVVNAAGGGFFRDSSNLNPNSMRPPAEQLQNLNGDRDVITGLNPSSMRSPAEQRGETARPSTPFAKQPVQSNIAPIAVSPSVIQDKGIGETLIGRKGVQDLSNAGNAIAGQVSNAGDYLAKDSSRFNNAVGKDYSSSEYGVLGGIANVAKGITDRAGQFISPDPSVNKPVIGKQPENNTVQDKTSQTTPVTQGNSKLIGKDITSEEESLYNSLTPSTSDNKPPLGLTSLSGDGYSISVKPGSGKTRIMEEDQNVSRSGEPIATIGGQKVYMKTGVPVPENDAPMARSRRESTPESRAELGRTIARNADPAFQNRLAQQAAIVDERRAKSQAFDDREMQANQAAQEQAYINNLRATIAAPTVEHDLFGAQRQRREKANALALLGQINDSQIAKAKLGMDSSQFAAKLAQDKESTSATREANALEKQYQRDQKEAERNDKTQQYTIGDETFYGTKDQAKQKQLTQVLDKFNADENNAKIIENLTPNQKQAYSSMTSDPHFIEALKVMPPDAAANAYLKYIQTYQKG